MNSRSVPPTSGCAASLMHVFADTVTFKPPLGPSMGMPSPRTFLEACGALEGIRLRVRDERSQTEWTFSRSEPFAVIGRLPLADVPLVDAAVSRRHAYLQFIEGRLLCVDLRSRTGLWARGRKASAIWLSTREPVSVGPFSIRWAPSDPDLQPSPELGDIAGGADSVLCHAPEETSLSEVTLEFRNSRRNDGRVVRTWQLDRSMTFAGRASGCKIRFADPEASPFQCSILNLPSGVWVVDLVSSQSLRVKNQRVRWARMADGDILQISKYDIQFHVSGDRGTTRCRDVAGDIGSVIAPVDAHNSMGTLSRLSAGPISTQLRSADPIGNVGTNTQAGQMAGASNAAYADHSIGEGQYARELVESIIAPVLSQLSILQGQMFDQFQDSLVMVTQLLGTQQKSQQEAFQQELNRLVEINRELIALQYKLAQSQPAADSEALPAEQQAMTRLSDTVVGALAITGPPLPAPADDGAAEELQNVAASPEHSFPEPALTHDVEQPAIDSDDAIADAAQVEQPVVTAEFDGETNPEQSSSGDSESTTEPISTEHDVETTAEPISTEDHTETTAEPISTEDDAETTAESANNNDGETDSQPADEEPSPNEEHAWLCERLRVLQRERESQWRKIAGFMFGRK